MNPHRIRPKRGRPRNTERDNALQSGALTYRGKPCRKGHKERYVSTSACVACNRAKWQGSETDNQFGYLWE